MAVLERTPEIARAGDEILGPDGLVSRTKAGYEPRRPQIAMANLCGKAMDENRHALVEAGTGTGKSYGYLIPAILSGRTVVVSTDTINLQEQLVREDLPYLSKLLEPIIGRPLRFAIAKGRGQYFCERNALGLTQELPMGDLGALAAEECVKELYAGRWDGDKATLRLAVPENRWGVISGDESCTGRSCPQRNACAYLAAKAKYEEADVIITNHAMYLLHHYVQQRSGGTVGILPAHAIWIADEAHTLADKCVDTFGVEVHNSRPAAFLKRLQRQAKVLGLDLGDVDAQTVHRAARDFFETFHGAAKDQQLMAEFPPEIIELAKARLDVLVEALKPIRISLYWALAKIEPDDREKRSACERLHNAADLLIENLTDIFAPPTRTCMECLGDGCADCGLSGRVPLQVDDHVTYAEVSPSLDGGRNVTLHRKPIETRPIFQRILSSLDTAIFTSATLAAGSGLSAWKPVADELGLDLASTLTLQAESPFDYPRQVIGYIPEGMPEGRSPEYHTVLASEIAHVLNYTLGRAFVLFTSRKDLERCAALVSSQVRYPVLCQGDMPKDELIRQFLETPNSVLFGNKSFWAGVDIPGDRLSCVILVKLPFPQFDHPLNKARCDRIERRGGKSFFEFTLPRCIRDVKQGFGRLIRTRNDEGVFAILDPRMREKSYGRQIADALPDFPCVSHL